MVDGSGNSTGSLSETTRTGMFAMVAMMAVCCLTVLALVLFIPMLGLPAGAIVAGGVGAALMYGHMRVMKRGAPH